MTAVLWRAGTRTCRSAHALRSIRSIYGSTHCVNLTLWLGAHVLATDATRFAREFVDRRNVFSGFFSAQCERRQHSANAHFDRHARAYRNPERAVRLQAARRARSARAAGHLALDPR